MSINLNRETTSVYSCVYIGGLFVYVDLGSVPMPRSTHPSAVMGPMHQNMTEAHVLIVGAGGIGCELGNFFSPPLGLATDAWSKVKNMALAGFKYITLLDLDTIDLSNLNRQFLFRKRDVKQSKAIVSCHLNLGDAR